MITPHSWWGFNKTEDKRQFLKDKDKNGNSAQKCPQAAYIAFGKSSQQEWMFLQNVVEGHVDEYQDLT